MRFSTRFSSIVQDCVDVGTKKTEATATWTEGERDALSRELRRSSNGAKNCQRGVVGCVSLGPDRSGRCSGARTLSRADGLAGYVGELPSIARSRTVAGYARKMCFLGPRLCLFTVLVLGVVSGSEVEECTVETAQPFKTASAEDSEVHVPEECAAVDEPRREREEETVDDEKRKAEAEAANEVLNFVNSNGTGANRTKVNCLLKEPDKLYEDLLEPVEIVNGTTLTKLLVSEIVPENRSRSEKEERQIPGKCILVLFYAPWCVFSSHAAPHYNLLPVVFPEIKAVAIDATEHSSFIAHYGIVGVPTLMLVHNGKPVAKFNGTVYKLEAFAKFIRHYTNVAQAIKDLDSVTKYVPTANYPLKITPTKQGDPILILSWVFIGACASYFTTRSRWWQQFVEHVMREVQNTWRESNAQHDHTD